MSAFSPQNPVISYRFTMFIIEILVCRNNFLNHSYTFEKVKVTQSPALQVDSELSGSAHQFHFY